MSRSEDTLRELAVIVRSSHSPLENWTRALEWASAKCKLDSALLENADLQTQIDEITSKIPSVPEGGFLYFGIFEEASHAGFYVSGGNNAPKEPNDLDETSLTISKTHLRSKLLDDLLRYARQYPNLRFYYGYALTWAAAAILAGYAAQSTRARRILVGFDSGDVEFAN